jgi:hypothetical protein
LLVMDSISISARVSAKTSISDRLGGGEPGEATRRKDGVPSIPIALHPPELRVTVGRY